MAPNRLRGFCTSVIGLLVCASPAYAYAAVPGTAAQTSPEGTEAPGTDAPTPADPYALIAAGWGPEVWNGMSSSRWAEDWAGMRAAGHASSLKAMSLDSEVTLTVSAEPRLRYAPTTTGN